MSDYRMGFRSLHKEVTDLPLQTRGTIPPWLDGALVRNGGAVLEAGNEPLAHWFDGYGMVHRMGFADGAVRYTNRILRSPAYTAMVREGRAMYNEYVTVPERTLLDRLLVTLMPGRESGHNALVDLVGIDGRIVCQTETPGGIAVDPHTLDTEGVFEFDDREKGLISTAHPIYDFKRRCVWNLLINVSPLSGLTYQPYRVDDGTRTRSVIARHRVKEIPYLHSFGASEDYFIIAEWPSMTGLGRLMTTVLAQRPYALNYQWQPDRGTRFLVFHKDTGALVGTYETEAAFAFHHVNAFEKDGVLVIDVSAYADTQIVGALYLAALRRPGGGDLPFSWFRRYRIDLASGGVTHQDIATDHMYEMPQVNETREGHEYKYSYGYSFPRTGGSRDQFINRLIKLDVEDGGGPWIWHEPGCFPGEPVYVPRPGATAEDDGVILSVVLDTAAGTSYLLVLDAGTFDEMGRAHLPHPVPFEFHGRFFGVAPDAERIDAASS